MVGALLLKNVGLLSLARSWEGCVASRAVPPPPGCATVAARRNRMLKISKHTPATLETGDLSPESAAAAVVPDTLEASCCFA
ncbi:hypothetical protein Tco_0879945 [Tanacetum coccineum]